jgi:hypothetical protein
MNAAAFLGAHGDVLQVRIFAADPPGDGSSLVVGSMDATFGIDQSGQRIDVSAFELFQRAPVHDQADDGMVHTQRVQRIGVHRIPVRRFAQAGRRQP